MIDNLSWSGRIYEKVCSVSYWRSEFIIKKFLAIDFGTTQTSVALLNESSNREPEIIEINDGQRVVKAIATAMQLDENGNILHFGAKALAKSEDAPERTFQNFKVFVGSKDKTYQLQTAQEIYTPDKLALLYLTQIRKLIEEHYFNGSKLSSEQELFCVIGYPADWDNVRKENLKNIAQEAGFPHVKLCDEPTGVIYYNHFFGGLKFKKSQNILVYDFGGGTTDVAIARVDITDNGEIKPTILAVGGLPNLGGSNFDEAIATNYLNENHYDLSTLSSKDKLHDKWVVGLAAREAKEELSKKDAVKKTINRLKVTGGIKPQKLSLSRVDFMTVCAELIKKFDEPVYDALTVAGLSPENINFVILAGGSSAMPYVMEKMSGIFSVKKIFVSPSTEIIAQGLAVNRQVEVLELKAKQGKPTKTTTTGTTLPGTSSKGKNKWLYVAVIAVLIIGTAFFVGRNSAVSPDQQKLELEIELNRVRAEKEKAEQARVKAEQAKAEAERKAKQQIPVQRYLGKKAIQDIITSYGFNYSYISDVVLDNDLLGKGEEVLGVGAKWFGFSPYIVFTNNKVIFWSSNGMPLSRTYDYIRNQSFEEANIENTFGNLPNAPNVIKALLEIKNY